MALGQRTISRALTVSPSRIRIFWMSTSADPNRPSIEPDKSVSKPISEILAGGTDSPPPLPVDESAAALELRLQKETDGRQEDKFYAIAIGTVLLDTAVF